MTENMSDNRCPTTKKRKANDGRATTVSHSGGGGLFSSLLGYFCWRRDEITPTTCGGENLTQKKLDAMMQMMSRMEEKCSRLETECTALKTMLGSLKEHVDHVDSKFDKQNEYNNMIVKNQSWKYSTPVHSFDHWETNGFEGDVAEYLSEISGDLKDYTEKMRKGEFPHEYSDGRVGINVDWGEGHILDNNASVRMRPHWREFADAIKQFGPVFGMLPDGCETYFTLDNIQLASGVPGLLKDALMHKPFQKLCFVNRTDVGDEEGMTIDSIMDIINSNKHLRKIIIGNNRIQLDHIAKICSAVNEHSLVQLDLRNCFENGLGDAMIASLLRSGGLAKLERLDLESNGITSNGITLLANFLATNPILKELDLMNNDLRGDCVILLANALRSNTSLRILHLYGNTIGDAGKEALRLVLHDDSSLNSIADSNHSCVVVGLYSVGWNINEKPESFNRSRKLYKLLSERNTSMSTSNVQHFGNIDVKILPFLLKAVQRYASVVYPNDHQRIDYCRVEPLSIVYEVMRKWDKVFPLYTS
jgi:hypothetical protein